MGVDYEPIASGGSDDLETATGVEPDVVELIGVRIQPVESITRSVRNFLLSTVIGLGALVILLACVNAISEEPSKPSFLSILGLVSSLFLETMCIAYCLRLVWERVPFFAIFNGIFSGIRWLCCGPYRALVLMCSLVIFVLSISLFIYGIITVDAGTHGVLFGLSVAGVIVCGFCGTYGFTMVAVSYFMPFKK
jgi:hypothetical protein